VDHGDLRQCDLGDVVLVALGVGHDGCGHVVAHLQGVSETGSFDVSLTDGCQLVQLTAHAEHVDVVDLALRGQ
jgi:hypothetical protein